MPEGRDANPEGTDGGQCRQRGKNRGCRADTPGPRKGRNAQALVRGLDPCRPLRNGVVGHKHIEVRHVFEQPVGEHATQRSDRPLCPPGDNELDEGRRAERKNQGDGESQTGGGEHDRHTDHTQDGGQQRDHQGLNYAQRKVLQLVHIAHEPGQQIPSPGASRVAAKSVGSERHQSTVDADPHGRELPERGIVAGEALHIAGGGPQKRERTHPHDCRSQEENGRMLGRARDEPGRGREQSDRTEGGDHAEKQPGHEAA